MPSCVICQAFEEPNYCSLITSQQAVENQYLKYLGRNQSPRKTSMKCSDQTHANSKQRWQIQRRCKLLCMTLKRSWSALRSFNAQNERRHESERGKASLEERKGHGVLAGAAGVHKFGSRAAAP